MWMEIDFENWVYVLHPRPVAIIAAKYKDKLSAMPASWVTPVSRRPPILAVAISKKRYTYHLIAGSREFTVNILPITYLKNIQFLGTVSGRDYKNKIMSAGLTMGHAKKVSAPIINESTVVIECILKKDIESGDHNIITGEILEIYAKSDPLTEDYITSVPLHIRKSIYTVASKEFKKAS